MSTSSSTDPDQIRERIEQTQAALSSNVDALTEKVSPGRVVARRVDRVRHGLTSLKDNVMGSTTNATTSTTSAVSGVAGNAGSAVSAAASSAAEAVSQAPQLARRQTRGNPLAAGLVAFGAGWLLSSLLPSSRREQQLMGQAADRIGEQLQPVVGKAQQIASEMTDTMRQPVSEAVDQVRTTTSEAAATVADESRTAAQQAAGRTQQARGTVAGDVSNARR